MMNEWIISSSLLIGAVLLGRMLLRDRISLRLQYALWAVVLIRLLLPCQLFTGSFGAGSVARSVDISEPIRQVYISAREDAYEREYAAAYSRVAAEHEAVGGTYDPVVVEEEARTRARRSLELDVNKLLLGAWFAGMVVMTSVIASCNVHLGLHLKRRRRELPIPDSLLSVYVTEAVPAPCVFGLFHPAIYLTPEAAGDEVICRHVLTHELTHYRHGDHIWSVLRSLCLILHWYNPLVWMAASVSRADAELACDEGALLLLGDDQRADYGRTLIRMTCPDQVGAVFVTATTMTGSAGSIRERIKLLMKRPRNTLLTLTAVVLIGAFIVGCAFTGAADPTGTAPDRDRTDAVGEPTIHDAPTETTMPLEETPVLYVKPLEQAMADYADRSPRTLTEKELERFRTAFATMDEEGNVNPAACFLISYYDDVTQLSRREFLAYFPTSTDGTREEFELLKEKYPEYFADWTWESMPLPIHRFETEDLNEVLGRCANMRWEDMADDGTHYLEQTGAWYNYTSDFGLGGFYAREGFVYDGGAVVYSDFSALFFTETMGNYTISAHLPAIESME